MAMLTTAYLKCWTCGKEFPLNTYSKSEKIVCPFCLSEVDRQMIDLIMQAQGTVADVNDEFEKRSADNSKFSISLKYEEVHLPSENK